MRNLFCLLRWNWILLLFYFVDSKDLISKLLVVDKKARYKATDVLCHQWIISAGGSKDLPSNLAQHQAQLRQQLEAKAKENMAEWKDNRALVFAHHDSTVNQLWTFSSTYYLHSLYCLSTSIRLSFGVLYMSAYLTWRHSGCSIRKNCDAWQCHSNRVIQYETAFLFRPILIIFRIDYFNIFLYILLK